jgi:hypothetical protein
MALNRLESMLPKLANALDGATKANRAKAVKIACEFAIVKAGVSDTTVVGALHLLGGATPIVPAMIENLQALVNQFDEEYFMAQDKVNDTLAGIDSFQKARAVAALVNGLCAGSEAKVSLMADAIYEATMTVDDAGDLVDRLNAVLIS